MASLILKLGERELSRLEITGTPTFIGRDERCDLHIDNNAVSRLHARIVYEGGSFIIADTSSGNGIAINGRITRRSRLAEGSQIQIGKFTVVFTESGGVAGDRLDFVGDYDRPITDVQETTNLDPDYVAKLREGLRARARKQELEDEQRSRLEEQTRRARRANRLLLLFVVLLGTALVYTLLNRLT